ncbi:hypothetical protein HN51_011836 [Arachis hypogaea]|uniref:uncharacterized protein isoform X1 n=1 Tax=Arachis hypogaea TaxID=3818 RepID=UPI000DECADA6|nr:uncharacterized protein LOC112790292 isoform X1 [Arachis hypogaea]QHO57207.1 uncharacterized protein DS421_3g80290 [Arachis hypogaea]
MTCSKEVVLRVFNYASGYFHLLLNHVSTSFQLLFLFLFSLAIFLLTFSTFTGRFPLIQRDQQYEYVFSEDDEEEEEEAQQGYGHHAEKVRDHVAASSADSIHGRETLLFEEPQKKQHCSYSEEFATPRESLNEEDSEFIGRNADSVSNSVSFASRPTSTITMNTYKCNKNSQADERVCVGRTTKNKKVQEAKLTRDDRFFIFDPTHQFQNKKLTVEDKHHDDDDDDGDSCIDGSSSTPRVSSEWRSSIHFKDSETEEALSSSSRRSCPKWESYTLFQKYDEEMSLLDRISAQKLEETEYLRSMEASPRSISERIASSVKKKAGDIGHNNPYGELEAAYVAQICLTWEALNWNYKNFESKHGWRHEADSGCPASTAQQFQQFQVLLQRYIENEPYEHGRRPEIYARMRLLAPKLLLVPQCPDWENDEKHGSMESRISSASFLKIMEDGIRTFMKFLKADKEKPCQMVAAYFWRNRRITVDPTLLRLIKKVNQKKRKKVKDVGLRKRKLRKGEEEEMDVLMAMIDLKVVSRVLRMKELSEAQLHWCEHKMSKVRIVAGKLQTDYSTPLFFPSI